MAKTKQPELEVEVTEAPEVPTQEPELQWESVQDPNTGAFSQRLVSISNPIRQRLSEAGLVGAASGEALKQQLLSDLSDGELEAMLAERKAKAEAAAEAAKRASEGQ